MAEITYPTVNLKPGAQGTEVIQLQNYLVSKGYLTQADVNTGPGIYGPKTKTAVTKLQESLGVPTDGFAGFFGPKTRSFLTGNTKEEPLELNIPSDIPSSDLSASITNPISSQDLEDLIATNNQTREKIVGLTTKSEEEITLNKSLADILEKAGKVEIGLITSKAGIEKEPISAGAQAGRKYTEEKASALQLQTLGIQERNILTRLGLAQEERTSQLEGYKVAYGFDQDKINLYLKIQDTINTEKRDLFNQTQTLAEGARSSLNIILDKFKGITFEKLDSKSQTALQSIAVKSGIPMDIIIRGMKITKDQVDFDNLQKQQKTLLDQKLGEADLALKGAQLAKVRKETRLLGEPTPEEKAKEAKALASQTSMLSTLKDKVDAVDILKNHKGLNQRVGPNMLGRLTPGFWGNVGKIVSIIGIPTFVAQGLQETTGQGQEFSGGIHKLVSQEFLDKLINVKSQGAVFGNLTDKEGDALRASASAIADWEIKDKNNRGIGIWNIDQASFKKELDNIQKLAQRAITLSNGKVLNQDEQSIIDTLWKEDSVSNYFK